MTPFEQAIVSSPLGREVDTVVVTGRPTLSRPIHALLARPDVRVIVVDVGTPWVDISGNASVVVPALAAPRVPSRDASWAARVRSAADEAASRIDALLTGGSGHSMLDLARAVAAATTGPLVLGASNPVRAFDLAVASLSVTSTPTADKPASTAPSPPPSASRSVLGPTLTATRPRPPAPLGVGNTWSRIGPRASQRLWAT